MFDNILVPIDLEDGEFSERVLEAALALRQGSETRFHFLTVVPGFGMTIVAQYFPKDFEEKSRASTLERLEAFVAKAVPADVKRKSIVATGSIYDEILKSVKKTGGDLIVMGAHRPGLEAFLLGPNAAKVVRHAGCSVFVVRP
ncbi:MAG: universal stress protein [Alphaproteobacteria bacterium]|nr:universal stress protein [Alphaproteobacteria bacterium]